MTRRLLLVAIVVAALAASLSAGVLAPLPAGGPPVYALGSALVWHAEVAAVLSAALYGAIVTARLALHGQTYTRVGRDGIDIPQVGRAREAGRQQAEEALARLTTADRELWIAVDELRDHVHALHQDRV